MNIENQSSAKFIIPSHYTTAFHISLGRLINTVTESTSKNNQN